jgi:CheY-like chemotaxis protein
MSRAVKIRIVYAEDNRNTRDDMLKDWEQTKLQNDTDHLNCVAAVPDAEEAWEAILTHKPDVAVLDIHLNSSQNGLQLARALYRAKQSAPDLEHIKVLLLSKYDGPLAEALENFKSAEPYCQGLIEKNFPYWSIRQAVSDVYDGLCFLRTPYFTFDVPTRHEKDFLVRAACPDHLIAKDFRRTVPYVNEVFASLQKKMRVSNRAAVMLAGLKIKLFSTDEMLCMGDVNSTGIDAITKKNKLLDVWKHMALPENRIRDRLGFDPEPHIEEILDWLFGTTSGLRKRTKKVRAILYAQKFGILDIDDFYLEDDQGEPWISRKPGIFHKPPQAKSQPLYLPASI